MSLSRQSSTSSISSSGSDFEDYYPIRDSPITYKDEPYYYDGISDEELHSHLNDGFEYVINLNKYGIAFSSKDILNDEGGDYIYYDVEEREAIKEILPFLIHVIFLMTFLLMKMLVHLCMIVNMILDFLCSKDNNLWIRNTDYFNV